jgi:hypothetical protein
MPKRTFWLITGAAVGAGSSLWMEHRVRRTVREAAARLQPDALVAEVGRSAKQVAVATGDRVKDAVATGRVEMRRHEDQLWSELAERGIEVPSSPAGAAGATGAAGAAGAAGAGAAKSTPHLDN